MASEERVGDRMANGWVDLHNLPREPRVGDVVRLLGGRYEVVKINDDGSIDVRRVDDTASV